MTCKDCLHRDGCCNFVPIEGTIEEKAEYLYECLKKPCKDFKNKDDFVEVVRCKDCKYRILWDNGMGGQKNTCDLFFRGVVGDEYCSYGKREEGAKQ